MTKKDLRTGMVVTNNGGKKYRVLLNAVCTHNDQNLLVNLDGSSYMQLSSLQDDLTYLDNEEDELTIIKVEVEDLTIHLVSSEYNKSSRTTVWERPKKPQYYSGKVVCTVNEAGFTKGKIYEFKEGNMYDNDGCCRPMGGRIKAKEIKDTWFTERFIEVVE